MIDDDPVFQSVFEGVDKDRPNRGVDLRADQTFRRVSFHFRDGVCSMIFVDFYAGKVRSISAETGRREELHGPSKSGVTTTQDDPCGPQTVIEPKQKRIDQATTETRIKEGRARRRMRDSERGA
jgi:hypothetical protein